jgi:hypothetical protein
MILPTTSSNYTLRKKDISIFQYPDALAASAQDVRPAFGKMTRFCAGVQKLVQRYAVILLTNIDSQPDFKDFGTDFLYTIQGGISPVDQIRASQIFNLASYDAVTLLKSYQASHNDIPNDEKIASAQLTNMNLYAGYAAFEVTLYTEAGDSIEFIIPLPK